MKINTIAIAKYLLDNEFMPKLEDKMRSLYIIDQADAQNLMLEVLNNSANILHATVASLQANKNPNSENQEKETKIDNEIEIITPDVIEN